MEYRSPNAAGAISIDNHIASYVTVSRKHNTAGGPRARPQPLYPVSLVPSIPGHRVELVRHRTVHILDGWNLPTYWRRNRFRNSSRSNALPQNPLFTARI